LRKDRSIVVMSGILLVGPGAGAMHATMPRLGGRPSPHDMRLL